MARWWLTGTGRFRTKTTTGSHDSFFESWVDSNHNNKQDPDELTVGDAILLREMGANTIRAYHHIFNKPLFRKLYQEYGLRVMVGDLAGRLRR